jgi:hypothetical protein
MLSVEKANPDAANILKSQIDKIKSSSYRSRSYVPAGVYSSNISPDYSYKPSINFSLPQSRDISNNDQQRLQDSSTTSSAYNYSQPTGMSVTFNQNNM